MIRSIQSGRCFFFDGFEADLKCAELRKLGQKLPLPEKSFQVLALLLERPREMVSRDELRTRLWRPETHVDFDHNLVNTVARLRHALGDSARDPRYVETIGSRGYRFIATVVPGQGSHWPSGDKQHKTQNGTIRLAVLPFKNYCPGPMCRPWLSDGLTEEVIARLGHMFSQRLGIIAHTSSMKYRRTAKDIGQIGRELAAGYILEGSVRCMADHMCVTAHLIRVRDGAHQWAESYEYQLGDILRIQNQVAESIAETVGLQLLAIEVAKNGC